jgi:heme/copper-type cytochrome/quinol oxidase subunit 2
MNETLSPAQLNFIIIFFGGLFLLVMWGSFYFFVRFKRKDDARRDRFNDEHTKR